MTTALKTKKDFSAGGLVWDRESKKVLLIQAHNLTNQVVWTFPKGHPENKETDQEAALREVQEETGWACAIDQSLEDSQYFYVHKKIRFHKTVRWFFMRPLKKVGEFSEAEILQCQWVDLDKAAALLTYESDAKLLRKLKQIVTDFL